MNGELLRQIPLFESLSKDARDFIRNRLKGEIFKSGEVIVRQGDTGNSLYIITTGLVKVTKREKDGTSRELARLQAGDHFGEMSLLAGQPRSADITAITDTTTLILNKADMDKILQDYPAIAVHFSKILSKRLRDTSHLKLRAKRRLSTIALYARRIDSTLQAILAINFAASVTKELMKRVVLVDLEESEHNVLDVLNLDTSQTAELADAHDLLEREDLKPFIIQHKSGLHILAPLNDSKLRERTLEKDIRPVLEKLKAQYDYVVLNCSSTIRRLIQGALEHSDLIVYLTPTDDEAIQRCKKDADLFIQGYGRNDNLILGVLKEDGATVSDRELEEMLAPHAFIPIQQSPGALHRFFRSGRPFVFEEPKALISRGIQRLSRRIGRVRVGIALGSGAARGFAHVGILKVLEAQDIPFDIIAGSSMGAMVGGFYAAGVSAGELEQMVLSFMNRHKVRRTIFDITLPLYGLSKGIHLARFMRSNLSDITFDELPTPFIAVATDIGNGSEVILQDGVLWKALRASASVPVMFEPFPLNGRYLIDGGITNPLPTDILIERGVDIIISCTVNSVHAPSKQAKPSSTLLTLLKHDEQDASPVVHEKRYGIIDALTRSMGIMSAANTMQKARLADIDIRPDVSHIDWTDFHRGDELIRAGVNAAEEAIPPLLELLHGDQ